MPWGGGASTPRKLHERTAHARARGDFAEYSAAAAEAAATPMAMCAADALRLRLVMRHTVIARLGLRVSLRAGLSGLYRAGKAHIYLHAD